MITPILNEKERDELARVIGEMETHTSGELRLIIVRRSVRGSYVLPALWLALVCMSLLALWYQRHMVWLQDFPVLIEDPWWFIPSILGACALLAYAGSRSVSLQRLFITPEDMHHAVMARAELEFYREGLNHTKGSTGILLFVSLFERKAVVLADLTIASRLPPSTWDEVVQLMLQGAKTGQWRAKLEEAIRRCGKLLAEHFPGHDGDINELSNTVLIKD